MHNWEHPVALYHRLVRQLHHPQPQGSSDCGGVCITHHRGQTTCPPGHLQHPMSQEGQKDHQGQPPEPLPVHPATIQKARSVQVHQSWDRETEKLFLSQGHQPVKQSSLTQRLLPTYRLEIIGHFNKWITSHFNNVTLIMFTYLALLISYAYTVFYTIYCIYCRSIIAHPYIYIVLFHSFT